MRSTGEISHAGGLGSHDHLCWCYADSADFIDRALEFIADGLSAGLQVRFVAEEPIDALRGHLDPLPDLDRHLRRGAVQVARLGDTYRSGHVVRPAEQVGIYAAATEEALAAGFSGLRVVADATPLVRTTEQAEAFVAYEHFVDRYMATNPFSALCAYRTTELPSDTIAKLACVHPLARVGSTLFRLYAVEHADLALAGEIDLSVHDLLEAVLGHADPGRAGGPITIDARDLSFIDHKGVLILRELARRRDTTVVLRSANQAPARIVELLDLDRVVVEAS